MKSNEEAQSEAPSVEDILHDFAVEESLREMNLSDKLKRKVITADEYDDRLTEGYRKNLEEAVAKINRLIIEAQLRGFDKAFDSHDYDGLREYRVALSNNLSKGAGK